MTNTARSETGKTRRSLKHDTSGMALIYVTVALPVIIGMALLAVDFGRLATLQSSLQAGADSLALAGAAELDLRPDALTRANYAIDNLITQNKSLFATTVATINAGEVDRHFLDEIPANDATPIDASWLSAHEVLTDGSEARFVVVKVNPQQFDTIFPATFLGASSNSAQSSAEAVAGFTAAVCKFTPLLMCNPFEPDNAPFDQPSDVYKDYGLFENIKHESYRRKLIALKSKKDQWQPGNFGYLQPYSGHGTGGLADEIAAVSPPACFRVDDITLDTAPGNREPLKKAFNVRFDLYDKAADKVFPPALNVRKGYYIKKKNASTAGDPCNKNDNIKRDPVDYTKELSLPRDACHLNDTCTEVNGRIGGGDWGGDYASTVSTIPDFYQYWNFNHTGNIAKHPNRPIPSEADLGVDVNDDGSLGTSPIPNNNPPSRYSIYRYELKKGWESDANANPTALEQEVGTPLCNGSIAVAEPDRRIIYAALMNCRANGLGPGHNTGLVALAFAKFFVTEPMQTDAKDLTNPGADKDQILYTEIVGITEPGDADSVARDIVQLYR